jgi:putative salt-induced outer membrane protein YdiY
LKTCEAVRFAAAFTVVLVAATLVRAEEAAKKTGWSTSLSVGANMATGNSDTRGLNGSLISEFVSELYDSRIGIEDNYSSSKTHKEEGGVETTSKDTTADNTKIFANAKRKFDRNYIFSDNSLFRDRPADIDYRLVVGAGLGRFLVNNKITKLGADLGLAYLREELKDEDADDSIAYRVSTRLDQKLGETSKCWISGEYLPRANKLHDYLLNAEAGVEAALSTRLNLRFVIQDRFDSRPPTDRERNDMITTAAIAYKL